MSKKAQLATMDFLGSIVIFVFLIITIILVWDLYNLRLNSNLENEETVFKLVKITDLLVETQGIPTNWNTTNVQVIGLTSKDRKFDSNKLYLFKNLQYNKTRELFNIENYDFYFKITDLNGALISANNQFIEIGPQPEVDNDSIITIRRFALYGSQKVILEFSVWK